MSRAYTGVPVAASRRTCLYNQHQTYCNDWTYSCPRMHVSMRCSNVSVCRCTAEPVGVHFLWAPRYLQHGDRIQRYLAHRNASRPLIVVAGVLYHNVGSNVPPG